MIGKINLGLVVCACLALLAAVLVACAPSPPAATPTSAPAAVTAPPAAPTKPAAPPKDEKALAAEIQKVVDQQFEALRRGDENGFMGTIEQSNLTWKRVQNELFRQVKGAPRSAKVAAVKAHRAGYYKVFLDFYSGTFGPLKYTWVFRQVDGKWLHAEPDEDELGKRTIKETEHFRLRYYEWDEDIIDRVGKVVEAAYDKVVGVLKIEPKGKVTAILSPTFQTYPGRAGAFTAAHYNPDLKDTIYIRSLESFGVSPSSPGTSPDEDLGWTVAHEFTHLVSDQKVRIVRMTEWMSEGLAEWVSNPQWPNFVRGVARGKLHSLDEVDKIITGKAEYGYSPAEVRQAYDEAISIVDFIIAQHGGLDTFWKLAADYDTSRSLKETVPRVLGLSYAQFEKDWQTYVRQKYGR